MQAGSSAREGKLRIQNDPNNPHYEKHIKLGFYAEASLVAMSVVVSAAGSMYMVRGVEYVANSIVDFLLQTNNTDTGPCL